MNLEIVIRRFRMKNTENTSQARTELGKYRLSGQLNCTKNQFSRVPQSVPKKINSLLDARLHNLIIFSLCTYIRLNVHTLESEQKLVYIIMHLD